MHVQNEKIKLRKNQKLVTINKPKEVDTPFLAMTKDIIVKQQKYLTPTARFVWMILMVNIPEWQWAMSPSYFQNNFGIDRKLVQDAINELIDVGYLEPDITSDGSGYILNYDIEIDDASFEEYKKRKKEARLNKKNKLADDIDDEI